MPALFFLCALLCELHLLCDLVRGISISQQLWLVLGAHPEGTWEECTANPPQGGETVPSSETPLGSCPPNTGVVHDVLGPAQDVSDMSALSQAAGKMSQLPPTRESFYRGWGN